MKIQACHCKVSCPFQPKNNNNGKPQMVVKRLFPLCTVEHLNFSDMVQVFNAVKSFVFSVEFEDSRDAEDSVRGMDGTRVCGVSILPILSSDN